MAHWPDLKRDKALSAEFIEGFRVDDGSTKYIDQLTSILERKSELLEISLDDVETFARDRDDFGNLLQNIEGTTTKYLQLFAEAADEIMQDTKLFPPEKFSDVTIDTFDILRQQREERLRQRQASGQQAPADWQHAMPAELLRRYNIVFLPRQKQRKLPLRKIDAKHVGKLVTLQGVVAQVTDVRPLIKVATYIDEDADCEVYQLITGRSYKPLDTAPEQVAARGGNKQPLLHSIKGSKFVAFQEIKIQEMSTEVPQGSTPRGMKVQLQGALTRTCKPGQAIEITGIFMVEPLEGLQAIKMGLLSSTYLEAMQVKQLKQGYQEHAGDVDLQTQLEDVMQGQNVYDRLSSSLAPEIFGHEDVKKAMLLLMVGGVSKTLSDGLKLRGDIHICLMGDPGVAKSQLIKHITHVAPRAVYTTGKGSSGVGLTAAVQRDPITQEMVLEGGALVLADKGICCIDEFDKMDESDRTNLHEVMEQQTVSIAKAGINTTLNTRTTLLAAANPAWGRYDKRRTPAENINLPPALLSRFDILWLILDKVDADKDQSLAQHVMAVHQLGKPPQREGPELLSPALLRAYIARAKTYEPFVPRELTEYIATVYAELRAEERKSKRPHSYTTPRTLQSILRLAQALARLRFNRAVSQMDIDEALRLMKMSKMSLLDTEGDAPAHDPTISVYTAIRDDSDRKGKTTYDWAELVALLGRSFSNDQIRTAVEEYWDYNVFEVEYPRTGEPRITVLPT